MLRVLFTGFVAMIALALASRLIARLSRVRRKGDIIHPLSPPAALLWGVLFMAFGISVVVWLSSYVREISGVLALAMSALYIAVVAVLAAFLLFHHVFWTKEGIGSWDPWRKAQFVRWREVTLIRHYGLLGLASIADGKSTVIYSPYFRGAKDLAFFLEANRIGAPA